jgi:hypothetical protein
MQSKRVKDGLAAVSVSTDPKARRDKALEFLRDQKAEFTNLLLDEPASVWSKKLDAVTPTVWVFGRDGRLAKKFSDEDVDYDKIGELVDDLLKK